MRLLCLWRRIAAALILSGTVSMTNAQTNQPLSVRKIIFDNGLTVLVREDHSAPVVTAQAWCRAGSITEGKWMGAGLSHMLEHMLFKGTSTRGVAAIAHEVENKGGYINAYTSFEQTVYHINLPSENWQTAVDILADCMMNAAIPEDELLKEKQVILREMAMNVDDPVRRANKMLWANAYLTHPYRHPVIGYPDIYNRITRDDVMKYYKTMYVPNNLVFVVVGDVNGDQVESHLRGLTKDFKRNAIEPLTLPAEPPQLAMRDHHEEAPIQLSQIYLAWHIPAITSPDVYPLDVLAIIAGQGRSSRLYSEVLLRKGLVHSISASSYTPSEPGLFIVNAVADADKRDLAINAIREETRRFVDQPVADGEWRKGLKVAVSQHLEKFKTMDGQASDLASSEILAGDPNFSDVYLENLRKVTPQDIRRVAQKYFSDNNLTVSTLDPSGTAAKHEQAAPAAVEIAIQKFELPNGMRLLVREDPKLPFVDFRALLKGGVIAETGEDNGITKLMSRMLLKGTITRTADEIATSIESVGGEINYFSGNNSFGVSAHVMDDDFDLALDLLADVLQNPTFPGDMLTRERGVQMAEIKAEQDQILRYGQQLLREAMFARHPYRLNVPGKLDSVSKLTREQLAEFHKRFVVPNNIVFTVFGNVRADEVRRKVEAKFGQMQPTKLEFPRTGPERIVGSTLAEEHKPKEQAVVLIGFAGTDIFNKDRFTLELIDEAYSGQGSRVFMRIRDELGLAYYVGAYQLLGLDPGYFAFYVGTTPQKAEECEKEIFAELNKLEKDGLTEAELERAKNSLIGQRKVHMQDNADLSMTVGLDESYGLGYNFFQTIDAKYRAVTIADVKRAANKYFANQPHAVIIVRPSHKD
jgi:zinc protease